MGEKRGGLVFTKRRNIQSGRDNKRRDKRQLWMAGCPRGVFAVIMSERVAELQRGAIRELEDGGWRMGKEGGGVRPR